MGLQEKLQENKQYIIIAGFAMGILFMFDLLPKRVEMFGLDENIKFIYAGVIGLAMYTFHSFYWGNYARSLNFNRTVASRSLSNPAHLANIHQQRMTGAPSVQRPPVVPTQQEQQYVKKPSNKIWDTFNRD